MLRRLTAILAIWVSLLGVAMPVLACSAGEGCCPALTQPPCAGGVGELQWNATVGVCCSAGPTSAYVLSADTRRSVQSSLHPGPPDHLAASGWASTEPGNTNARLILLSSIPTHRADASLTYLRTGRLRL